LKDQLDILIQDKSAHFSVQEESMFVRYIEDKEPEAQGVKVRLRFSDTIEQAE
jgi:hypothetical protein